MPMSNYDCMRYKCCKMTSVLSEDFVATAVQNPVMSGADYIMVHVVFCSPDPSSTPSAATTSHPCESRIIQKTRANLLLLG
jgi:hypothetical protein